MSPRSRKQTSSPPTAGNPLTKSWVLGALLVLATILAYQQAWHAGYIWDDDVYVTGNKLLTAPDGFWRIWFSLDSPSQYFPLVYSTFRLEHALWGFNPAGYHWVNIFLHTANALLVWRLLYLLRVPGAWLGAAFFALHPVQVESVAWITELKNVMMGFFFLLALLAWIAFVADRPSGKLKFYGLALVCYALALCSKTTACTLPAALFLVLWLQQKPIGWRRILEITPFVALGLGMGLVTIWWERYHQGAQGAVFAIGLPERVLVASRAIWFYLGKLIWPAHLSFSYPRWTVSSGNPLDYVWLLLTVAVAVAIYFVRRRIGRSVEVAAVFFVATLSPVLGFIMLYTFRFSFVADHYQYLASIGPLALAAAAITVASRNRERWQRQAVCGGLLLPLGILTWRQCAMYANIETLWQTTISENPRSWMAHNNLGNALLQKGRVNEAIAQFNQALKIDPDYAVGHSNLGNALLRLGRAEESLAHIERALEIDPRNAEAENNLGNTLMQMGRRQDAVTHYGKAIAIDPHYAEAYNNLGATLLQMGRLNESLAQLQKALTIDPESQQAQNNLGNTLLRMARASEALAHYDKAVALAPNDVNSLNNLAWLLATSPEPQVRDGARAVELSERADHLTGGQNATIIATLAAAEAEAGHFPEAIKTAQRALDLALGSGQTTLSALIREQIALYQSGSPSRDIPPASR